MRDEILYMAGIVLTGFLVNYSLRALPFALFSGRDRELPPWIERLGGVISPVIIGLLIVYAYSGSAWRTPWPYLAGLVTVALQVWKRNPLLSIIAGTALYMTLLSCCGCATRRAIALDARNPSVRVSTQGVLFGDLFVPAHEVPAILEDYDVPHTRVIHIRLDPDVMDLRPARTLMGYLSRAGYTRPVLVMKRHALSENRGRQSRLTTPARSRETKPAVRHKRADE